MNIDDSFYIGIISKKFGYRGELIGVLDVDDSSKYLNMESVFLFIKEKLIPFFIEKITSRPNSNQIIIKFKDINDEEKAEQLLNSEMYLPLEMLPPLSGNNFYFHEVEGFHVYDLKHGYIGQINKILDYTGNPLIQVKMHLSKHEVLIPLNNAFINDVNRKEKRITVETPEGLLDIF